VTGWVGELVRWLGLPPDLTEPQALVVCAVILAGAWVTTRVVR
jgi:hypothetical protein